MSVWKSQQGSGGGSEKQAKAVDISKLVQDKVESLAKPLETEISYLSLQLKTLPSYVAPHQFPYAFSVVPNETAQVHGILPVKVDLPTLPPVTMYALFGPYTAPSE